MIIHLAESSNERGQYQSLIDTKFPSHLLSYAYRNSSALEEFMKVWSMLVYLASSRTGSTKSIASLNKGDAMDQSIHYSYDDKLGTEQCLREVEQKKMDIYLAEIRQNKIIDGEAKKHIEAQLESWAYKDSINIDEKVLPRILIDSGAFTAFTTGKIITPEEYGTWALSFKKQWEYKVKSLHFFNLDVIGDQIGSDRNLHKLESMGLEPIPIFTYGGDSKNLQYYLNNYEYIGLGGLVGKKTQEQLDWIRYCFSFVIKKYKQTGILPKIHLLGITKEVILKEVPCYSSDSSSWVACLRFGNGKAIGKEKIPKYTLSEEALRITIITLKNEIRKYKKMQDDVTHLWKKRGIVWED